jgi:hypothetical protein
MFNGWCWIWIKRARTLCGGDHMDAMGCTQSPYFLLHAHARYYDRDAYIL